MNTRYKNIAKRSFETRLNLYIFSLALECKSNVDYASFKEFKIEAELVKTYTSKFWQYNHNDIVANSKTVQELFEATQAIKKKNKADIDKWFEGYLNDVFINLFKEVEFEKLINESQCNYCHITEEKIEKLANAHQLFKKNERGWKLEIDRLNSNYEYTSENTVMCCYWCNNAKTDEFSEDEFKLIGATIEKVWQDRLNKI